MNEDSRGLGVLQEEAAPSSSPSPWAQGPLGTARSMVQTQGPLSPGPLYCSHTQLDDSQLLLSAEARPFISVPVAMF